MPEVVLDLVNPPLVHEIMGELARAEERARLDEVWALLRERVESCRRQDAAVRAAREEAMNFAKETRDSVKRGVHQLEPDSEDSIFHGM